MKQFYDTVMEVAGAGSMELGSTKEYRRGDLIRAAGHHYIVTAVRHGKEVDARGRLPQVVQVVSDPDWS